jgi:hypothetical protein
MDFNKEIVDKQVILDLLYGDEDYFNEFISVSIESFTEFKDNYRQSMRMRDMTNLRKTGHKIKPVAQMMKLDPILEMYEESKELLEAEAPDKQLSEIMDKMNDYCEKLIEELKDMETN